MIEAVKFLPVTPTQKLVLFVLADCHNEQTGQCDPSGAYIQRATGFSNRPIWKAIHDLEAAGHLTIKNNGNGGRNCYALHPKSSDAGSLVEEEKQLPRVTSDAKSPVTLGHSTSDPGSHPPVTLGHKTSDPGSHKPEGTGIEPERTGTLSARAASPKFTAPTLPEWQAYAGTLQPAFPAFESERAWNHYVSNGWKVGKNPCKDWQACCRTCHGRWRSESANPHNGRHNGRAGGHADRFHPESQNPTRTLF